MTLWAMAFILCCLALACVKVLRPSFRFWPWFAAIGLAGWIAFNLANVTRVWRTGTWTPTSPAGWRRVDCEYLAGLSPDVLPRCARLSAAEPTRDLVFIASLESRSPGAWSEWSLSLSRYGRG